MKLYSHFSEYERAFIDVFHRKGKSIRWIAKELKRNASSISREIRRNSAKKYDGLEAHESAVERRRNAKHVDIHKYCEFLDFLYNNFDKRFMSIEVLISIAKARKLFVHIPSHQSVYNWIKLDLLKLKKHQLLRSSNKYSRRKTAFTKRSKQHRTPIHLRPRYINERKEVGHWECDSVTMSNNGERIITLVERVTKYAITFKSKTQNMEVNYKHIKDQILRQPLPIKSITFDNGMEFNMCYKLKYLGVRVYYCHPYAPSERGTNEVWNGFLRRFIPKGTDLRLISESELQVVTNLINKTPRKILGWKSSLEAISLVL